MKRMIIVTLLCASLGIGMKAQQTYTLEDCCRLALKNNTRLKTSHLDVESAKQERQQAFTNYFPIISATGMAFQADKGMASLSLGSGMEMSLLKNGITAGVTAMLPIFTGGRIVNGNKLAKLGEEVSQYKLCQSQDEVKAIVEQYYWQLVTFREKLKTVKLLKKLTDNVYKDVKIAVEAGIKNRNELLQVQLKQDKIAGDRLRMENAIDISHMILAQYIGLPADSFNIVQPSFKELPSPETVRVNHKEVLQTTTSYKLINMQVRTAKLQKRLTLGQYLPSVSVGVGYMYHNFLDSDRSLGVLMVSVSIPISNWWSGSHALKRTILQIKSAEYRQNNTCELLLIQMQRLYNDMVESYKQIKISNNSIHTAKENVRLNTDYYHAGTSTLSDLLNAQSLLQTSYDQFTENYTNYLMKKTLYLQATNR